MSCQFIHNDQVIGLDDIVAYIESFDASSLKEWEIEAFDFIKSWLDGTITYKIPTSGSSGKPKLITVHRNDMELSARMTLNYLNIKQGEKAILCLPTKYIAGKMMIVRSIVGGLSLLIQYPSKNPLLEINKTADFIAITPHQMNHILENPNSRNKLQEIRNVIVGGGAVNPSSYSMYKDWSNNIYSTYGMTETLSHIAMSKLNSENENLFHLINEQFTISKDHRACLAIDTPYSHLAKLNTNDIVELIDKDRFYWLGRVDNVINSGGIKFMPEQLEKKIRSLISDPFIISSKDDQEFGEKLVLIIESANTEYYLSDAFQSEMKKCFDSKFEVPKEVFLLPSLLYTENDKIDRIQSRKFIA